MTDFAKTSWHFETIVQKWQNLFQNDVLVFNIYQIFRTFGYWALKNSQKYGKRNGYFKIFVYLRKITKYFFQNYFNKYKFLDNVRAVDFILIYNPNSKEEVKELRNIFLNNIIIQGLQYEEESRFSYYKIHAPSQVLFNYCDAFFIKMPIKNVSNDLSLIFEKLLKKNCPEHCQDDPRGKKINYLFVFKLVYFTDHRI